MTRPEALAALRRFWVERLAPAGAGAHGDVTAARNAALAAATAEELRAVREAVAIAHSGWDGIAIVHRRIDKELARRGVTP